MVTRRRTASAKMAIRTESREKPRIPFVVYVMECLLVWTTSGVWGLEREAVSAECHQWEMTVAIREFEPRAEFNHFQRYFPNAKIVSPSFHATQTGNSELQPVAVRSSKLKFL